MVFLHRHMQSAFGELGDLAMLTDVNSLIPNMRKVVIKRRAAISQATDKLIEVGVEDGSIRDCNSKSESCFPWAWVTELQLGTIRTIHCHQMNSLRVLSNFLPTGSRSIMTFSIKPGAWEGLRRMMHPVD